MSPSLASLRSGELIGASADRQSRIGCGAENLLVRH
jgi:hypothetical protein